jgi:hypothetical protein
MKIVKAIQVVSGIVALVLWFSSFSLFEHYDAVNPTRPDVASGAIYAQENHGHTVYLTASEKYQWRERMVLGVVLFVVSALLHLHLRSGTRSRDNAR